MIGCFDRPELLIPAYHYAVESRLPWVDMGSGLDEETSIQTLRSSTPV